MIKSFEAILVVNACITNNTDNKEGSHQFSSVLMGTLGEFSDQEF